MPHRYEVWTRPESANGYTRRFPLKDVIDATFTTDLFGTGRITLPANHPRLDEIQYLAEDLTEPENRASVIRVYHNDDWYCDLYVRSIAESYTDTGRRIAEILLDGVGSMMERHRLRQFDYPNNPSVDPDWIYGTSGNELDESWKDAQFTIDFDEDANDLGGFDELSGPGTNALASGPTNTAADAESGTRSLTFDPTQRHSGVAKVLDVSPGVRGQITMKVKSATTGKRFTGFVKAQDGDTHHSLNGHKYSDYHLIELDNVAPGGGGVPPGSTDGTWQDIAIDYTPADDSMEFGFQFDDHDGSNGPVAFLDSITIAGFGFGLGDWTSRGTLDTLTVDSAPPLSMNEPVAIKWKAGNTDENQNGVQHPIENQTVGQTKTLTFDVYHEAGAPRDFIIIVKKASGGWTASYEVSVPSGVKTTMTLTTVMQETSGSVQIRKSDTTAPVDVWISGMRWSEGQGVATVGAILNDLLDSKDTWIDTGLTRTFSDTLDSDGAPWDEDVALRFRRGVTLRTVIEDIRRLGYEFWIDTDPADDTDVQFNAYNPTGLGSNLTSALLSRPGLAAAGPIMRSQPYATYVMTEGDDLYWGEASEIQLDDEWGRIEQYMPTQDVLSPVTLATQSSELLDEGITIPLSITLQGSTLIPGIDFNVGDWLYLNLSEEVLRTYARCMAITVRDTEQHPIYQIEFAVPRVAGGG